jgi:hypothetical protein
VSAEATLRPRAPEGTRGATLTDRLVAAVPLASIYLWLSAVYMVEAWRRVTPWLFTDELEYTQLARSIAATGHPAERGMHHSPDSIYTYLTAPIWLVHDVATAYATVKYVDVLLMTTVVVPTYFLARLVVGKVPALFAAVAAGAIPAMAYSSYIGLETIAYPYAALCFYLIAKAFVVRSSRRWWVAAGVASVIAPTVRGELLMAPTTLLLALLFMWWSSEPMQRRRTAWSSGDWIGFSVLALGAIFLISAIGSHHSSQWLTVTVGYKHRIIIEGNWAAGCLAMGMGVLPFIAGLAALFPARGEPASREVRVFRSVSVAALVAFGMYTGMKAAWISTDFATRVEERNLIYVAPLLFVGTALVLSRRRVSLTGLVVAGAYTLYLVAYAMYHVTQYPYQMGVQLYSDALGFAIFQQANRDISWTPHFVRTLLVAMWIIAMLVLLAPRLLRRRRSAVTVVLALAATGVVGWNFTGELAAAAGTNSLARANAATVHTPFSWVDAATHLKPTLYMGESEIDQNAEWTLEFWNRSITGVSSLDGSLGGPGPAGGPNRLLNGTLYSGSVPSRGLWQYDYGVEDLPCVDFAGTTIKEHAYEAGARAHVWRLVALTHPNRLVSDCTGIYADGWSGQNGTTYERFSGPAGWLRITYSRRDWGYKSGPSPVHILLRGMAIVNKQPAPTKVLGRIDTSIDSTQTKVAWLRIPRGPSIVQVLVTKLFEPAQYIPGSGDRRELGAEISYRFLTTKPTAKPHK